MAFRAFYALPADTFVTSTGQHTNAVYGFTSMLVKLLADEQPTHVAVAFDVSRHSFRTDEYPEYKAGRAQTPPEFSGQIDLVDDVVHGMGIQTLRKPGYEADDILATLAAQAAHEGWKVLVVSGDRDAFQTINDHVSVLYPGMGPGDLRVMDAQAVQDKYGVPPQQYPEIAALVGEQADNLPGVPGVGPKTAAQWLVKFGGLEKLLSRADEIGGKRGMALREHLDDVRRNRKLNRLLTDLDVGVTLESLRRGPTDMRTLNDLFDSLEIGALRKRVEKVADVGLIAGSASVETLPEQDIIELQIEVVTPNTAIAAWIEQWAPMPTGLGIWVEGSTRPGYGRVDRLAIAAQGQALVCDCAELSPQQVKDMADVLSRGDLVVHDGKGVWHALKGNGWDMAIPVFDVELAGYLARPEQRSYDVDALSQRYLNRLNQTEVGGEEGVLFDLVAEGETGPTAAQKVCAYNASLVLELRDALMGILADHQESDLLSAMELPVQGVLRHMEEVGVAVDRSILDELHDQLKTDADRAAQEAFDALGHPVNLASPKQLQEVLFTELEMPKTKKTKTGYTTNAAALQELYVRTGNPFLEHLLAHRDRTKLLQMVDTLRLTVTADQRIHTTYSQVVASTGRLASSDPNLQNIPARTADGRQIRHAFVAGECFEALMSADYSQIEMRIMAHLSEDQDLIDAFNSGEDLHRTMAAMVFNVPVSEVTGELRSRIKRTSYGLAYGLSAFGLAAQLGISVPEAAELRERYFERFAGVRDYLEQVVAQARRDGFTQTMFKRRRYLPDLHASQRQRREIAERAALNAPIQGSAADIIKIAMVNVDRALSTSELKSRLLLQIHDELIVEVAPGEAAQVEHVVREQMASPVHMDVPLEVAVGIGHSWLEAAH